MIPIPVILRDFARWLLARDVRRAVPPGIASSNRVESVKAEEAETLAQRLRQAVRRPDLWRFAPNPLLLIVMALVHTHRNRLPDARCLAL